MFLSCMHTYMYIFVHLCSYVTNILFVFTFSKLDQQYAKKRQQIEEGQLVELEAKHARLKVEMRERHYQEVIDAFSEMAPKTASLQRSADAVREAVKELETVKLKLEAERKRREEKLDQQRKRT